MARKIYRERYGEDKNDFRYVAKQSEGWGDAIDDCGYDDILVYDLDGRGYDKSFTPGSMHKYDWCRKYADYANDCLDSDEFDELYDTFRYTTDILEWVCGKMDEEFGGNWVVGKLVGFSQGDGRYIIYDTNNHSDKGIEYFENDFYNNGYNYRCYVDGEYEVTIWVNDMDADQTEEIICGELGCDLDELYMEYM